MRPKTTPSVKLLPLLTIAFSGWEALPQKQKVKFINIAQYIINNPNYQTQVIDNQDEQNRRIDLEQLIQQAVSQERKREFDLYKR